MWKSVETWVISSQTPRDKTLGFLTVFYPDISRSISIDSCGNSSRKGLFRIFDATCMHFLFNHSAALGFLKFSKPFFFYKISSKIAPIFATKYPKLAHVKSNRMRFDVLNHVSPSLASTLARASAISQPGMKQREEAQARMIMIWRFEKLFRKYAATYMPSISCFMDRSKA